MKVRELSVEEAMAAIRAEKRELKKVRAHLVSLTSAVLGTLKAIDAEMRSEETVGREERLAEISNTLERVNDAARYFGLGIDFRTDVKR